MATPTDLITTRNGRRCTRSRARTAATSILTSTTQEAAPPELTTSTTEQATTTAAAIQTTTTAEPPPPSSTSTTQAAPPQTTTSTTGTSSAVLSLSISSALAPVAVAPDLASEADTTQAVSAAAVTTSTSIAPSTTSSSTTSNTLTAAATTTSAPSVTLPPSSTAALTSVAVLPDQTPSSSAADSAPELTAISTSDSPSSAQPSSSGISSGGDAGVLSPEQSAAGQSNSLTIPADGQANVAGIAGGVAGGFVAIAIISALLFLCLRRRKTGTFERWQQKLSEKGSAEGGFAAKIKAASERLKAFPAGIGVIFAKIKGKKSGPSSHPYRRHTLRSSVSSVYSAGPEERRKSINESTNKFRQQLRGFGDRMPSLKRSRTLLQKKPDSLIGDKSPFPRMMDDPVQRSSKGVENPFEDPEPPKNLFLLNPDPPTPRTAGLKDQQRPPLTPKPAAVTERSKDPFESIMDELEKRNGSGTPEWLKDTAQKHKRTTSSQTALRSHPPSNYSASVYTVDNPFFDPSDAPPVPTQPLPPNPPARAANPYGPLPSFNATSSTISRDSDTSFFFGEPGSSRPGTNMLGSRVRQSDPFDLDRPEVLSFGAVNGRGVRASVTRQNSRARRSNVPNWVNVNAGPYSSNNSGPALSKAPSVKR